MFGFSLSFTFVKCKLFVDRVCVDYPTHTDVRPLSLILVKTKQVAHINSIKVIAAEYTCIT